MKLIRLAGALLCLPALSTLAQTQTAPTACSHDPAQAQTTSYVFRNITQQNDANELLTAARNIVDPRSTKLFLIPAKSMVVMRGCAQELELAKKVFSEGDKPRPAYVLYVTVAEFDGNKRLTSREYSVVAHDGQRAQIKNGQKIPVITSTTADKEILTTYQFVDVGTNVDLTPTTTAQGVCLRAKVESTSVAQAADSTHVNPTLQQTISDFTADLVLNKDTRVTTMDLPNGHRMEISLRVTPM